MRGAFKAARSDVADLRECQARAETLLERDTDQSDASGVLLALAEPFHGLGGPARTATLPEAVIVNRLY